MLAGVENCESSACAWHVASTTKTQFQQRHTFEIEMVGRKTGKRYNIW